MTNAGQRLWESRISIVRFLSTGVAGALVNVALFLLLAHGFGVDYRIAIGTSFAVSNVFSFVAHRSWTFAATDGHMLGQGARFVIVSVISTVFAMAVASLAVEGLGLPKNVGALVAGVLTAPVSFALHRSYTFGVKQRDDRQPASQAG